MPVVLPSPSGGGGPDQDIDIYQMQIRSVVMGKDTAYKISDIKGLGIPDFRVFDRPRPNEHGVYASRRDLLNQRTVEVDLMCVAPGDAATAMDLIDALIAAWEPPDSGLVELKVRLPGWDGTRVLFGRPRTMALDIKQSIYGVVGATLQYVAQDPRLYDSILSSNKGGKPVFPGLGFDVSFDVSFGGLGGNFAILCVNTGDFSTKPTVVIQGPVRNPSVANLRQDMTMKFNITLGATDNLTIDFDERTILLNNEASRYNTLALGSQWWDLQPGRTNVRFLGADADDTTSATVYWRNAWL